MNTITLSKESPEIAKAVAGCEIGVPQKFTITATPVADNDTILVATIDSIEYDEEDQETPPETEAPAKPAKKPYKPRTGQDSALSVAAE